MQYVTAWGALIEQAKLGQHDFVLVTAASSSVGLAAFQIARMVGATPMQSREPVRRNKPFWMLVPRM
jgi:NADPH:quinone reductase-like Zn-dependent oxidoreductase